MVGTFFFVFVYRTLLVSIKGLPTGDMYMTNAVEPVKKGMNEND